LVSQKRNLTIKQQEQERFERLYAQQMQALKLQGKRSETIDGYAKAGKATEGFRENLATR